MVSVLNKITINTSKLVGGLDISKVLYVSISNDRDGHAVFDRLNCIIMDGLVAFIRCTTMDSDPGHASGLGLLAQVNCPPNVLMNSEREVNEWCVTIGAALSDGH